MHAPIDDARLRCEDCDVVSLMAARSRQHVDGGNTNDRRSPPSMRLRFTDPFGASAVETVTITLYGIDGDLIPI